MATVIDTTLQEFVNLVPKNSLIGYTTFTVPTDVDRALVFEKEGFAGVLFVFVPGVAESQFLAAFPMSSKVTYISS